MPIWKTEWTGKFPNHCHGEWILYRDGAKINVEIPFAKLPAATKGCYQGFYFDDKWNCFWYDYIDGMDYPDWSNHFFDFLKSITTDMAEWKDIYRAFQKNDWRFCSCGGCI